MPRTAVYLGRTLAAAASAAVLAFSGAAGCQDVGPDKAPSPNGSCSQTPGQCGYRAAGTVVLPHLAPPVGPPGAVLVRTDLPASRFWPRPGDGVPDCSGCVVRYELTPAYWSRLATCRTEQPFTMCRDTVPAEYLAYRVR